MTAQRGVIVELNPTDSLGWIEMPDGSRVRFGGTALKGFRVNAIVGTAVEVHATTLGYKGVCKATDVRPISDATLAGTTVSAGPSARECMLWTDFVQRHPRWSDISKTYLSCSQSVARPTLRSHPLFAPWIEQIEKTSPVVVPLLVPHHGRTAAVEPAASDSFAHGTIAFLENPDWPTCGLCKRALRMCVQLSPSVMSAFVDDGRGLCAMFCFHCGYKHTTEPRVGFVRLVAPRHSVTGPPTWTSDAEKQLFAGTHPVTTLAPVVVAPHADWYRYRAAITPDTASSVLFDGTGPSFVGPFPAGVDPEEMLEDLGLTFDDWIDSHPRPRTAADSFLGGIAHWDQGDSTPSCAHGEMVHLLDYNGGQFLDAALHVFACRTRKCDLAFVAEF